MRPKEHIQTRCPALLSYLSNIQPQPHMTHHTGIRACKSSCWCTSCGACWSLDDYHSSRGCPIHKQVKEVMAYNVTHNMRMVEARQPSEEDVPMLAIGRSSVSSNDRNMCDISKGPLELGLDQNDTLPLGTETTDQHARGNESCSPSHNHLYLTFCLTLPQTALMTKHTTIGLLLGREPTK